MREVQVRVANQSNGEMAEEWEHVPVTAECAHVAKDFRSVYSLVMARRHRQLQPQRQPCHNAARHRSGTA